MQPFVGAFYTQLKQFRNTSAQHSFNSNSRFCIEIWRIVSVMLFIDRNSLAIPLLSVAHHPNLGVDCITKTDASPWKIVVPSSMQKRADLVRESDHQNLREFLCHILQMIVIHKCIPPIPGRQYRILWIGDYMSALKWGRKERCNSQSALYANWADAWLRVRTQVLLLGTEHCAGINMGIVDDLSRNKISCTQLDPHLELNITDDGDSIKKLFMMFDPTVMRTNLTSHRSAFMELHHIMQAIIN